MNFMTVGALGKVISIDRIKILPLLADDEILSLLRKK